jgi:hypothetical protein
LAEVDGEKLPDGRKRYAVSAISGRARSAMNAGRAFFLWSPSTACTTLDAVHERAVAITDFILALECAVFAFLIARRLPKGTYRMWLLVFFVSIAAGALCGGITHAYFPDDTPGARATWVATMLAIGVTALACWNLSAEVLGKEWVPFRAVALGAFVGYAALVIYGVREYRLVIINYLPAALFLLVASVIAWRRGESALRWTALGLVLTFAAAAIQIARIALPPINHNALYHLVQAVALLLIYVGFVRVSTIHQP